MSKSTNKNTETNKSNQKNKTTSKSKVTNINAASSKSKKLTMTGLERLANQTFNEKRKVSVCNGEFEIEINENFKITDIQSIAVEYLKIIEKLKSMKDVDEELIMASTRLIDTLVLRKFSTLPIPETDDIAKLIKVSDNLLNLGIVKELFSGGENSFKESEIKLVKERIEKAMESYAKTLGEIGLMSELNEVERNRIDVDDYFAELDAKGFEISEDEDLGLLVKVMDQLNADDIYDQYMDKLTADEIGKLNERLEILENRKIAAEDDKKNLAREIEERR